MKEKQALTTSLSSDQWYSLIDNAVNEYDRTIESLTEPMTKQSGQGRINRITRYFAKNYGITLQLSLRYFVEGDYTIIHSKTPGDWMIDNTELFLLFKMRFT